MNASSDDGDETDSRMHKGIKPNRIDLARIAAAAMLATVGMAGVKPVALVAQQPVLPLPVAPGNPSQLQTMLVSEFESEPGMIVDPAPNGLTLESLESMALSASPVIQQSGALVQAARGRAYQVGLGENPSVGIDFQQLGSQGLAEQYGVGVAQTIIHPQKLTLNRSVASHEANRLSQVLAIERQRVLTDVRMTYVRALRAERQLELTRQLVEIGEKGAKVSQELLRAQEASRADLLQAELEVESASILYQNALNAQLAVWRQLAALTGQQSFQPQPLAGDIDRPTEGLIYEEALAQIQSLSPEIAEVLAKINRARCQLQREMIETKPDVTVAGVFNWRDNGIGGDPDGNLVVAVPIPVFNKNQGAIAEARWKLTAAHRELERVEYALAQRLAPVFERYSNAAEQVDRYRNRILPKASETLELTRKTYELGEVSFINLLTVQRTYARNQLAYLDAMESLRLAEIEIAGLLLSGSLESR